MKGPMCAWGMTSTDEHGKGLVKKETCWVTNSEHIARELDRECSNVRSQQVSGRPLAAGTGTCISLTSGLMVPEFTLHCWSRVSFAVLARSSKRLGRCRILITQSQRIR